MLAKVANYLNCHYCSFCREWAKPQNSWHWILMMMMWMWMWM